jgi:hypothetical protein
MTKEDIRKEFLDKKDKQKLIVRNYIEYIEYLEYNLIYALNKLDKKHNVIIELYKNDPISKGF